MKELIKPNIHELEHIILSLCEVDCSCSDVKCNKDCWGHPNNSASEEEDILF